MKEDKSYQSTNLAKIRVLEKAYELGRSPMSSEFGNERCHIIKRLGNGNYNKALENVGIIPLTEAEKTELHQYRTNMNYRIKILKLANKLGKSPTKTEFAKEYDHSITPRIQENWNNILIELNLEPVPEQNDYSNLSDEDFLNLYIELSKRLNKPATNDDIDNEEGYPSYTTFLNIFKNINNLRIKAGFEPIEVYTKYTTNSIKKILIEVYGKYGEECLNTNKLKRFLKTEGYVLSRETISIYLGKTNVEIWSNVLDNKLMISK